MFRKPLPVPHLLMVLLFLLAALMLFRTETLRRTDSAARKPVPAPVFSTPIQTSPPPPAARMQTPQEIFKKADYLAKVLMIAEKNAEMTGSGAGSGFLINFNKQYLVLTALHVMTPRVGVVKEAWVLLKGDLSRPQPVRIGRINPDLDLAVLVMEEPDFTFSGRLAPINMDNDWAVGDQVYSLGSPLHTDYSFGRGDIMNLNFGKKYDPAFKLDFTIMHNAPIAPGSSGGPLVDRYGQVIGMNLSVDRESHQFGYASRMTDILKWLGENY